MYILSSVRAYDFLKRKFYIDVEEFHVVSLNSMKKVIDEKMIFRGTVNRCMVHPRDIFR